MTFAVGDRVLAHFKVGGPEGLIVNDLGSSVTARWLVLADGGPFPEPCSSDELDAVEGRPTFATPRERDGAGLHALLVIVTDGGIDSIAWSTLVPAATCLLEAEQVSRFLPPSVRVTLFYGMGDCRWQAHGRATPEAWQGPRASRLVCAPKKAKRPRRGST